MMRYSILDPTGNITALVESPVDPAAQPEAAREIMRLHPEVEQVGFLRIPEQGDVQPAGIRSRPPGGGAPAENRRRLRRRGADAPGPGDRPAGICL